MAGNPEDLPLGALIELENEYVSTGIDPANKDLLNEEIKRLKSLRGLDGKMMFKHESRLRKVAAFNVGLAVKLKQPKTA